MKEKSDTKAIITPQVDYATVDQLNTEIAARKSGDIANSNNITSLINDYAAFKSTTNTTLPLKQPITDNTLTTTSKTVPSAINELKTTSATQNTNISQNTSDISEIQADYTILNNSLDLKQNITDNGLNTTDKTVVGAINELKSVNDTQDTNISQNTSDINEIQADYVKSSDLGNSLDLKQNITDNGLNTTDKTVVGAINELKSVNDTQDTNITNLQTQVTTNTSAISEIQADYVKSSDLGNSLDLKQDKTDDNLTTTDTTVVGAINELNLNKVNTDDFSIFEDSMNQFQVITNLRFDDKQDKSDPNLTTGDITVVGSINGINTLTNANATAISNLPTTYMTIANANSALALKQNITDNTLTTTSKTVPGAINEIKGVNDTQTTTINSHTTTINSLPTTYMTIANANSALALKQNITDNTLNTTNKTIVGAINELKTNSTTWTSVGTSANARSWTYNLVINKKYRLGYNWNPNDTTTKNYREFVWTGNNNSIETYTDGFSGVTLLGITVLGAANIIEVIATSTGIVMANRSGASTSGRIVSLEEAS